MILSLQIQTQSSRNFSNRNSTILFTRLPKELKKELKSGQIDLPKLRQLQLMPPKANISRELVQLLNKCTSPALFYQKGSHVCVLCSDVNCDLRWLVVVEIGLTNQRLPKHDFGRSFRYSARHTLLFATILHTHGDHARVNTQYKLELLDLRGSGDVSCSIYSSERFASAHIARLFSDKTNLCAHRQRGLHPSCQKSF